MAKEITARINILDLSNYKNYVHLRQKTQLEKSHTIKINNVSKEPWRSRSLINQREIKKKDEINDPELRSSFLNYQFNAQDKREIKDIFKSDQEKLQHVNFDNLKHVDFQTTKVARDNYDFLM